MLRAKAHNSNGGEFFQKKGKPKVEAPHLSYTKNSIFGIAVDSVKRLCDQKKLLMYLSPSSNDESASAKRTPVKASTSAIAPEFTARNEEIESPSEKQALSTVVYPGDENQDNRKIEFGREQEEEHYEIPCSPEEPSPAAARNIDEIIGLAATNIGKEIGANCIISIEKKQSPTAEPAEDDRFIDVDVIIFRRAKRSAYKKVNYKTRMRRLFQDSVAPLKEILAEAINREYIKKGDRVVCVQDGSLGMGYKGLLFIFDVDNIFFNISAAHLSEGISSDVIESVINIALEISKEGFEGKSVGTAFVIGDRDELLRYSKQMIINPFAGYPEECRKITDPELKQTIKNFAQLDGVFLIDTEGVVLSAGVYLNADMDKELCDSLIGFGTRHRCCAAITKCTSAVSVVLSQSGGKIRIFKNGKIILKLP